MASPDDASTAEYARAYQLTGRFAARNPAVEGGHSGPDADVIPLNRTRTTARNMTPTDCYSAPPPCTVPYGWQWEQRPDGWLMRHHPDEWAVIERIIRERRDGGQTYDRIADQLQAEGVPAPTGRRSSGVWHAERVKRTAYPYAPELRGPARPRMPRGPRVRHEAGSPEAEAELDRLMAEAEQYERSLGIADT